MSRGSIRSKARSPRSRRTTAGRLRPRRHSWRQGWPDPSRRVVSGLAQHRRGGSDGHHPVDVGIGVTREVADEFPGSERVTDQGDVMQVEVLDGGSEVIRERVEVVSRRGPVGTAVAAAIVKYAVQPASARAGMDLIVLLIGPQSPGVSEHDGCTAAPLGDYQSGTVRGLDIRYCLSPRIAARACGTGWSCQMWPD
jgi:hypothetical protein